MVIKLLKSSKKRMKESPYYIGHNTTQKRAEIVDVNNILDKCAYDSPPQNNEEEDLVPELQNSNRSTPRLSSRPSSEDPKFSALSRQSSRTSLLEQVLFSGEEATAAAATAASTPRSSSVVNSSSSSSKPRLSSAESFESMFKPSYKYTRNSLLTSCAMSSSRSSLAVSGVAAAFYNGGWLSSSDQPASDSGVVKINEFIAETRAEVESGLPGRFLTVVFGSQLADLDSVVSTIAYAYHLHTNRKSEDECFVPVINMKRYDLQIHSEVSWLFKTVGLHVESLIFADEISLSYYHRFGILKLVLVGHSELEPGLENLQETVVEILDHEMPEISEDAQYAEKAGSCCTLVAEKFAFEAPDLLHGRGLSRLLLAGILLGTSNLDPPLGQCSRRDVAMATLLLNGAGRYGRNGFFKMLRKKVSDLSILSPREILNKEVKQWISRTGSSNKQVRIGLSSIGISLGRFLTVETAVSEEFTFLRKSKKLDILMVVTSYYDRAEKFKRELLIVTEKDELIHSLAEFYNAESLQLQPLNIIGMSPGMKAFGQGNIAISPAQIHQLTDAFIKQC